MAKLFGGTLFWRRTSTEIVAVHGNEVGTGVKEEDSCWENPFQTLASWMDQEGRVSQASVNGKSIRSSPVCCIWQNIFTFFSGFEVSDQTSTVVRKDWERSRVLPTILSKVRKGAVQRKGQTEFWRRGQTKENFVLLSFADFAVLTNVQPWQAGLVRSLGKSRQTWRGRPSPKRVTVHCPIHSKLWEVLKIGSESHQSSQGEGEGRGCQGRRRGEACTWPCPPGQGWPGTPEVCSFYIFGEENK